MRRRNFLPILAVALAIAGVVFGVFFLTRLPRTLTLAVGPVGQETHQYASALALAGIEARERILLRIVTTEGAQASARMLESRQVDLAIIRSDFDLPSNGQSLIVNSRRSVVIVAPQRARGGIQKLADLKGKRIAVARLTDPNLPLVRRILGIADIGEADATLSEVELSELPELLGTGKVDAVIAVVVPSAPHFLSIIPEIVRRVPTGIRIVPIDEAQAIANRIIGVETAEIPAGAFGARRPAEEIATVAISYRIAARTTMSEDLAARTTKSLYDLRTRVAREMPIAFTAEAPDAKAGARLPVHPGAAAYFDGETKTFFERYGEAIFTSLWGGSILGSGVAGLLAWMGRRRHSLSADIIRELAELTARARAATQAETLDAIESRTDAIVATVAANSHTGEIRSDSLQSIGVALEHLRSVLEGRREKLT